jgi:hypothetical protein
MAYYRAGWNNSGDLIFRSQFWVAVNGNFIDICVLEWCKLFGDKRGKHYWKKGISDPEAFYNSLLNELGMSEDEFNQYIADMRTYRDKYIAHLDLNEKFDVPRLDITQRSVQYLYNYLLDKEDEGGYFDDGPNDALAFYKNAFEEGRAVYRNFDQK